MGIRFTRGKRKPFKVGAASATMAAHREELAKSVERILAGQVRGEPRVTINSLWKSQNTQVQWGEGVSAVISIGEMVDEQGWRYFEIVLRDERGNCRAFTEADIKHYFTEYTLVQP